MILNRITDTMGLPERFDRLFSLKNRMTIKRRKIRGTVVEIAAFFDGDEKAADIFTDLIIDKENERQIALSDNGSENVIVVCDDFGYTEDTVHQIPASGKCG